MRTVQLLPRVIPSGDLTRAARVALLALLLAGGAWSAAPGAVPARAAGTGGELFRLIRYTLPGKERFLVVVTGALRATSFSLRGPDRLVVDLFGVTLPGDLVLEPGGGRPISTRSPIPFHGDRGVRALRLGGRADRTRLVFDLPGPAYTSVVAVGSAALLVDVLTADSRAAPQPTPLQVVTDALLERGTIVQKAEFGVWPVLVSGGSRGSREAAVDVAYASGRVDRYLLRRDFLAGDRWVVAGVRQR